MDAPPPAPARAVCRSAREIPLLPVEVARLSVRSRRLVPNRRGRVSRAGRRTPVRPRRRRPPSARRGPWRPCSASSSTPASSFSIATIRTGEPTTDAVAELWRRALLRIDLDDLSREESTRCCTLRSADPSTRRPPSRLRPRRKATCSSSAGWCRARRGPAPGTSGCLAADGPDRSHGPPAELVDARLATVPTGASDLLSSSRWPNPLGWPNSSRSSVRKRSRWSTARSCSTSETTDVGGRSHSRTRSMPRSCETACRRSRSDDSSRATSN